MAVGFFVDEGEEHLNSSYHTQVITTNSATQTPLQSPVSREFLVQAFCEALNRCSIAGSPGIITSPPPSPSCSHPNGNSDVFFPRGSSSSGSGSSSSSVQPSTPSTIRMHDDYRSAQWSPQNSAMPRRRFRLTSASDEDEYDEDVHPLHDDYEEHMQYMAARERLQEFPGRIPPRKKRDTINTQPRKSRDPKMWPAVAVTAVVLAVGCGFLVSR